MTYYKIVTIDKVYTGEYQFLIHNFFAYKNHYSIKLYLNKLPICKRYIFFFEVRTNFFNIILMLISANKDIF